MLNTWLHLQPNTTRSIRYLSCPRLDHFSEWMFSHAGGHKISQNTPLWAHTLLSVWHRGTGVVALPCTHVDPLPTLPGFLLLTVRLLSHMAAFFTPDGIQSQVLAATLPESDHSHPCWTFLFQFGLSQFHCALLSLPHLVEPYGFGGKLFKNRKYEEEWEERRYPITCFLWF